MMKLLAQTVCVHHSPTEPHEPERDLLSSQRGQGLQKMQELRLVFPYSSKAVWSRCQHILPLAIHE